MSFCTAMQEKLGEGECITASGGAVGIALRETIAGTPFCAPGKDAFDRIVKGTTKPGNVIVTSEGTLCGIVLTDVTTPAPKPISEDLVKKVRSAVDAL